MNSAIMLKLQRCEPRICVNPWRYSRTLSHLEIIINDKSSLLDRIKAACRKGRNSFYDLTDSGYPYLDPLNLALIQICRPTFCPISANSETTFQQLIDSQRLCVFQHSICKSIQNFFNSNQIRYV